MSLLLNWRLWLAVALAAGLAFSHFTAYRKGRNAVKAEWVASVAEANQEALRLERARQSRADDAGRLAAARANGQRLDADRARRVAGGLRDDLRAADEYAKESRAAAERAAAVLGELLQSCTEEYRGMAQDADRATSEAIELRHAWPTDTP